jgi:uracil-DNA glycosylase
MNLQIIDPSWNKHLLPLMKSREFLDLKKKLEANLKQKKVIYPVEENIFSAFNLTPLSEVKVVILGQDPYHGEGEAHGLCFSVQKNTVIPPSLRNIFKEIIDDLKIEMPKYNGDLTAWAKQGVFLLNTILTVEKDQAASHRNLGWEHFTDKVISILNREKKHLVFLLWGNEAKKKSLLIDKSKHFVLESGHPSPLSIRYFRGNKHFSRCNQYLMENKIKPIDWHLNEVPAE